MFERFRASKARRVCVVGCGKLGLPLVAVLANAGHKVVGLELNEKLVLELRKYRVPWFEASLEELLQRNRKRISFTSIPAEAIEDSEFCLVIVPSPSKADGTFDASYVENAISSVVGARKSREMMTLVVVSTLMPGATDEIHEKLRLVHGEKMNAYRVVYSPEFIALGSVVKDMTNPDLVLVGSHDKVAAREYVDLVKSYIRTNPYFAYLLPKEAEIAKIAVNSFVTTKISFANFISELCEYSNGASASEVLKSVGADTRIGRNYLKPGAPFGGPCFPRDNVALAKFAEQQGIGASIPESTRLVNNRQVERIASFVEKHANRDHVVLVGVAYKPGTAVTDESPTIYLFEALKGKFQVSLFDEYVNLRDEIYDGSKIDRDSLSIKPYCVVSMVPDVRYSNIPLTLDQGSMAIDLWGSWQDAALQRGIRYFRVGDILDYGS